MKRTILTALFAVSLLAAIGGKADATEVGYGRKFGLGVVIGDPTGLTAKWWIAPTNALDFGLGFWGYGVNNRCFDNGTCPRYGYNNGTRSGRATATTTASPSRPARRSGSI